MSMLTENSQQQIFGTAVSYLPANRAEILEDAEDLVGVSVGLHDGSALYGEVDSTSGACPSAWHCPTPAPQ